ncbi:MAG: GNAT family N-acetyltransferase [Bacteroidaceae bacterium]|nr:GNAT family N-acetyltransferase [Bacteroidaceae bacterium]
MNIKITCHHSKEEFLESLKSFDISSNPYGSYAYLSVFLKHHPKGNFYFFNIYEEERLLAIVPFECSLDSSLLNVKYFRFVGYMQATNYEQYICRDEDMEKVHNIFVNYLSEQKYKVLINYYDINTSSPLYPVLKESPLRKSANQLYTCPCLRFTDNFDDFFKTVFPTSKKRAELKKFQKKLSEIGNFRILNINDKASYEQNKKYIDQIYRVHGERFARVYATSFFGSPKMRPYYSELIESLMEEGKGFLSLLLMDEVVIAFILCLTNGETLIDWIPAFDPAFSKYSLGIVQYKMLFEDMCTPNVPYKIFDYSKGSSVYKRKWAKEETSNYQFVTHLPNWNIFSICLFLIETSRFRFKCYLRERGILRKVKHIIGAFLAWKRRGNEARSEFEKVYSPNMEKDIKPFKYEEILNFPVSVREEILNAIYSGEQLISIQQEGSKTIAVFKK